MNEIPQHWNDIIKSKPPAIDDGSFYYTMPEPLGKSGYVFRYVIETIDNAHGIPAGIYIETNIPVADFEADELNVSILVGHEVCLQLMKSQKEQDMPLGNGKQVDIGNTINLRYENFYATDGGVLFHLLPVDPQIAKANMQAVANGEQVGYTMTI